MRTDGDWDIGATQRVSPVVGAGISAIRVALLFGSAAVALSLIITPLVDRSTRPQLAQSFLGEELDLTSTGSVRPAVSRSGERYTIRRSVLQSSPSAICVIRANGAQAGDC